MSNEDMPHVGLAVSARGDGKTQADARGIRVEIIEPTRTVEDLTEQLQEAETILVRVVQQANTHAVDGDDGFIAAYHMPVGPVHAAIPFLQRRGIYVDNYGGVRRAGQPGNWQSIVEQEWEDNPRAMYEAHRDNWKASIDELTEQLRVARAASLPDRETLAEALSQVFEMGTLPNFLNEADAVLAAMAGAKS